LILDNHLEGYPLGSAINFFLVAIILLNVLALILESEPWLYAAYGPWFDYFEIFSVAVFSVEYVLRLWACTEHAQYARPIAGRLRYMVSFMAIIDLLAILPFYLVGLAGGYTRVLRLFRLFRLFRMLKLVRYSNALDTMSRVLRNKREEIIITMLVLTMVIIVSSTVMYYAENEAQPDKFPSILSAMWWAIITLATVGYGDVYPVTELGRAFGALTALFGVALFALPAGLIGAGFMEEIDRQREAAEGRKKVICPHCGRDINEPPEDGSRVIEAEAFASAPLVK
jgi:voltage-gated potassium channel